MRSLPDTSTHDQQWESNPGPSDVESNTLSAESHALNTAPSSPNPTPPHPLLHHPPAFWTLQHIQIPIPIFFNDLGVLVLKVGRTEKIR